MKKKKLVSTVLIMVIVFQCLSIFFCTVNAADRDSVKQSGEYYSGSIYGPALSNSELNEVADAVAAFLNEYIVDGMTDQQRVRAACDYLMNTCSYAASWARNGANTAWGALVYHEAQCSGYARAFKALCDAMGIGCYYVHADENSINPSHQWNVVCVDGNWYIIDVQAFDKSDELIGQLGIPYSSIIDYTKYYLVSDEEYASMGLSWDRSSAPSCPSSYSYYEDYYAYINDAVNYVYSGTQNIIVNGVPQTIETYNVNDSNYVKLRDIAYLLNGTKNNFNVVWDDNNNIIWIDTKTQYTPVGGELGAESGKKGVLNPTSAASFRVDGAEHTPDSYNIRNNNYYKLRDIGELIGFDVDWDGSNVIVKTK